MPEVTQEVTSLLQGPSRADLRLSAIRSTWPLPALPRGPGQGATPGPPTAQKHTQTDHSALDRLSPAPVVKKTLTCGLTPGQDRQRWTRPSHRCVQECSPQLGEQLGASLAPRAGVCDPEATRLPVGPSQGAASPGVPAAARCGQSVVSLWSVVTSATHRRGWRPPWFSPVSS